MCICVSACVFLFFLVFYLKKKKIGRKKKGER